VESTGRAAASAKSRGVGRKGKKVQGRTDGWGQGVSELRQKGEGHVAACAGCWAATRACGACGSGRVGQRVRNWLLGRRISRPR